MTTITDPARELADLCDALNHSSDVNGATVLATTFDVPVWSTEFYQIVFTISGRFDALKALLTKLDMDEDIRVMAVAHLERMAQTFTPSGLNNTWAHSLKNYISPTNVGPIRMLSPQVRAVLAYPKLDETELQDLVSQVDELRRWLGDLQLSEQDFIRQALLEGLDALSFRLTRVKWLGWGYTVASLKDVIGAYMALERTGADPVMHPDVEAVLKKTLQLVKVVIDKVSVGKAAVESTDFVLRAYGAAALVAQGKQPVMGLLSSIAN